MKERIKNGEPLDKHLRTTFHMPADMPFGRLASVTSTMGWITPSIMAAWSASSAPSRTGCRMTLHDDLALAAASCFNSVLGGCFGWPSSVSLRDGSGNGRRGIPVGGFSRTVDSPNREVNASGGRTNGT